MSPAHSLRTRLGACTPMAIVACCGCMAGVCFAQLTPEQRAGSGGRIPNPSTLEYYLGTIVPGQTVIGAMTGRLSGNLPSIAWYKYHSDGVTPVVFDLFGSGFGVQPGGFLLPSGPDSVLGLYDSQGNAVAFTEFVKAPSTGDSNIRPPGINSHPPLGFLAYWQPDDPRDPAVVWNQSCSCWVDTNNHGLSQFAFVLNPDPNPTPGLQGSDTGLALWDEYPILPAGDYFLAIAGYGTYFSRSPYFATQVNKWGATYPFASGPVTSDTPFGFVTFNAQSGYYVLNARLPGDLDLDGQLTQADVDLLKTRVQEFACTKGIPPVAIDQDGTWLGLPADIGDPDHELARFDLTGNHRIDNYDVLQLGRWTGLNVCPIDKADVDADCDVDLDDLIIFNAHVSGPGIPHDGSLISQLLDFDHDGDVDQVDFGRFQRSIGRPPAAPCDE